MSRATRLADALLQDRKHRQDNKPKSTRKRVESEDFDPFQVTRWRIVADAPDNPGCGYLPKTRMRMGPVGWFIDCRCCGKEFESKGWAFCRKCMAQVPAEERRARRKAVEHSTPDTPIAHRAAPSVSPAPSLQPDGTEIIEEFPPIFGPADWPTILIGSGRRGRPLPPDLVESVLELEAGWLFGERRRGSV